MDERELHYLKEGTLLYRRYRIKSVLGEGGFGITYFGEDELFGTDVAVKEFYPQGIATRNNVSTNNVTASYAKLDEAFFNGKSKFIREARAIARFNKNKGIVNIIDFFEENNTAYIAMEYLDGITLREYLESNQTIPAEEMLGLLSPLLESLDGVHRAGMIHRDISPDNIMVLKNGDIKLMDFGAARDYTEFGEKSLSIILKPGYAPPEQYQTHGMQGPWTDIYAICATVYKCLTGETPEDSIERVMDDHLQAPSELGVYVPKYMEQALMKGMNVAVKDRYQNLKDFCDDFYRDYDEGLLGSDESETPKKKAKKDRKAEKAAKKAAKKEKEKRSREKNAAVSTGARKVATGETGLQNTAGSGPSGQNSTAGQTGTKETAAGQGKKSGRKIIAAVIVCCLLLAGGGGYHFYQKSLEREMPSVVNMTYEEAEKLAAGDDESIVLVKEGEEYSDTVKKGEIISQEAEAGSILKKGDEVKVVISKGALVTVPNVTGTKKAEAKKAITDSKLVFVVDKKEWSDEVKKGYVISQSIKAGEQKEEGTTVSVVLSKGVEKVEVPDVTGKSKSEAKKALKKAKLKSSVSSTEYSDTVSEGDVISQSIEAGKKVEKNTTVKLVISKGEEPEPEPTYTPSSSSSSSSSSSRKRSSSSGSSSKKSSGSSSKKSSGGESISNWKWVD